MSADFWMNLQSAMILTSVASKRARPFNAFRKEAERQQSRDQQLEVRPAQKFSFIAT
jgi:plasmid maintenance system antidote protein VapI